MPNVVRLLFGDVVHISEESGKIIVGHILERKLPKVLVFVRIVFGVISGMFVSSTVSHPNIIAAIG
jgi:hypothetical protein